ncbi:hypothetical protein BAE44_0014610 [Dichanthelium oligosanthes]|uniref:Uncharacterized protein n=1 Tax=Dichanthelium oligosanthes TaxID=888268 RepID=A0A1E5VGW5_9POAL|nr:hypothetical protein BAE44_0014610 [Dichanthelium oligosanthes]
MAGELGIGFLYSESGIVVCCGGNCMDTVREEAWPVAAPQQRQQPPAPQPQPQQNGRIDLRELKAQLEKRVGLDRSRRYFGYLNGYLSERLSRQDYEKLCLQILGRENLQLHNRLIRSILYNAYQAKCPPPPSDVGRSVGASVKKVSQAAEVLNACNGDARLLQGDGCCRSQPGCSWCFWISGEWYSKSTRAEEINAFSTMRICRAIGKASTHGAVATQ